MITAIVILSTAAIIFAALAGWFALEARHFKGTICQLREVQDRTVNNLEHVERCDKERITQLENQNADILHAAEQAAQAIAVALPSLKDGEWGLLKLVNTIINERDHYRTQAAECQGVLNNVAGLLACREGEEITDRARTVSARAAAGAACADLLGIKEGPLSPRLIELVDSLVASEKYNKDISAQITEIRRWLGARKSESLTEAIKRVILTLECPKASDVELHNIRNFIQCEPGESVLEHLRAPVKLSATAYKRKGELVGVAVNAPETWPVIEVEPNITVKELE